MGNFYSKQPPKRPRDTGASSPTPSKRPRPDVLEESPLLPPSSDSSEKVNGPSASGANFLLPSSDSLEKINVLSESGANSRPSASSTSVIGNNYHVFLSFRGPDTRKSFVDHLYHRLKDVGLKFHPNFVFRDDESLPFGEDIAANLLGAIERSKVSIPVISENYAASEWCLRELIHIMECKESREQIVLPVLYKVKPKDVRHLGGSFGEAFRIHEHRFDEEVKQQGPTALKKALDLRVFESEEFADGCEGKLVNKLVEIIVREQQHDFQPHLPVNLIGIEDRVAEVMKLVDIACPDTRIIGIWGMGGIGKTTLATIIYNKLFNKFKCRSFLQDIRETTRSKGMEYVQSLMISDITKNPESRVHDSKTGITMIRSSCEKKVLILLDDIDRRDHLDNLIGDCNFKSGSRIIITCRDKTLLKSEYKMYELKEMNHEESFLLFSRYAFEEEQLPTNLATLSSYIVATTGGLPLALTIIGSLLNGVKDQMVWRETLKKLRNAPDKTVKEKLRISYDTLEYKEQQMFLDIACFFNGTDKRIATYLWEDLEFFPIIGLQVLIHRSLIKIDDNNLLRMHDQFRDLGRAIARPEDVKPWHWSRPWDVETTKILGRKEENENIEALRLDKRGSREFIKQESFKKMPNLKFLHVKGVDFDGDFEGSLAELRWLKWEECSDSFEATNFHLEKLVVLDLSVDKYFSVSNISENWRGWSSIKMERLKVLNLSGCHNLRSTPNLSVFKNLEMLILKECNELEEIDPSIRDVKRLVSLNLNNCWSLKKLPEQLGELEKLEELVVNYTSIKEIPPCIGSLKKLKRLSAGWPSKKGSSLVRIPSSIGKLGELLKLDLSFTNIKELPESIGELNKLKILKISNCHIKRLPSSIGKLQSLRELLASDCILEGQIHFHKGRLSSLKTLDLQRTKISGLPKNLHQLSSLECLDLRGCGELQSLPKPPCSLSSMRVTCRSNELPSLSHLKHLQKLSLWDCGSLQSIPSLSHLKHLQELSLRYCGSLQSIPSLSHLKRLQKLYLYNCHSLQSIPALSHLKHLRQFILCDCGSLQSIPELSHLKHLQTLTLSRCMSLQSIPELSHLEHLQYLSLTICMSLQSIPELPSCIRTLSVWVCPKLERLPNLSDLEFLSYLSLMDCYGLKKLDGLEALKSLKRLNLCISPEHSIGYGVDPEDAKVDNLHAISGLEKLGSLKVVGISGRKHIQVLDLSKSEHLESLFVENCKSLVEIRCPSKFLKHLNRHGCKSLKKLPDLLQCDGP